MGWRLVCLAWLSIFWHAAAGAGGGAQPPTAGYAVGGAVLDLAGQPIAGAQVDLEPVPAGHEAGLQLLQGAAELVPVARGQTDGRGRFTLHPTQSGLYRVIVRAPGRVAAEQTPLIVVEDVELDPVELASDTGLTIHVIDAAGRNVAGAWVFASGEQLSGGWRAASRKAVTDANGFARLPRRDGESLDVSVFAPGFAEVARTDVRSDLTVALGPAERGRTVRLQVFDPDRRPLSGALVRVGSQAWPLALTDAEGRAGFPAPLESGILRVTTADGRSGTERLSAGVAEVEIRLAAPVALTGHIRDAGSGAPLGGALVWSPAEPGRVVRTAPDGSYHLLAPEGRAFLLRAAAAGHLGGGTRATEPDTRARRLPALALREAVPLSGLVVGQDRKPLADVVVEAFPSAGAAVPRAAVADRRRTSAEGHFEMRRLAGGALYHLRATRPGFLPASAEVATPSRARSLPRLRLVLAPARPARGAVVDVRNRPLAGVRVVLRRAVGNEAHGPKPARPPAPGEPGVIETTTDARGRFAVAELPADEIDLLAFHAGYVPLLQRNRRLAAGSGAWDLGTIVLQPGVVLAGRVVDDAGQPVAGARAHRIARIAPSEVLESALHDEEPDVTTGPDGRFTLVDLPAGKPLHLFVTAPGHLPAALQGLRPPSAKPVTVRLARGARLAGRVLDESGGPVAGAEVRLAWRQTVDSLATGARLNRQATSNHDGRFEIRDSPTGTVFLGVSANGFIASPPEALSVPPPEGAEIEIRLERGAILEGRIRTTSNEPVAGARVTAGTAAGKSDAEGVYRIEGVQPGSHEVELFHPHYRRKQVRFAIEPGTNVLDFELEPGRTIAGRVIDERGDPIQAAEVNLETIGQEKGYRIYRAHSAPDGKFEIAAVAVGEYQVQAKARNFAPLRRRDLLTVAGEDIQNLELTLARGGGVSGQVLGLDPEQLSRVELRAESEPEYSLPARVDAAGRFEIDNLIPGLWELHATLAGEQREVTERVLIAADEKTERNLEFGRGLSLSGRVEYDGEPLPDARVSVRASRITLERSALTDHDGGFRLEDLEPDHYWLGVNHNRELLIHNETLDLSADREVVIRLQAGSVSGAVTDVDTREPIAAAIAQVFPTEGEAFTVAASTDESGRFRLPRVPPGSFRLRVTADGYSPVEQVVEVSAGPEGAEVEIELTPAAGLELLVRLTSGAIPNAVDVRAETSAGVPVVIDQKPVDQEGRVRLSKIPAGTWHLAVGANGAGLVRLVATVPGPPVAVTLPQAAPLHVQVPEIAETNLLASVALYDPAGKPLEILAPSGQVQTSGAVVGGRATLSAVPAGAWDVLVESPNGRRWSAVVVTDGQREVHLRVE